MSSFQVRRPAYFDACPRVLRAFLALAACAAMGARLRAESADAAVATSRSPADTDPTAQWEADYETGVLWRFTGSATPLSYTLLPQILSIKTPRTGTIRPLAGGAFVVRSRFSFLAEPIIKGPEHHYIAGTASGVLEWWNLARTRALVFAAGGGVGWLDSKGHEIAGAQGEDLNFTWFVYPSVRFVHTKSLSGAFGVYFQHVSNTNLNKINPGLNAIGPMLSLGWHF